MKWHLPWFNTETTKYDNHTPLDRLQMLAAFWNSDVFEGLSRENQEAFAKIYWDLEYVLGINDKPCVRCGGKPPSGDYYCERCLKRDDHEHYQKVVQWMHEDRYGIKHRKKWW